MPDIPVSIIQQGLAAINISFQSADVGGDDFSNDGTVFLIAKNDSGGGLRVRLLKVTDPDDPALQTQDVEHTVPAGQLSVLPAVNPKWYNTAGGKVAVSYPDGVTSLEVTAISFLPAWGV